MRLIIILSFITTLLFSQEYSEITVFNLSGVTTDTIRSISIKKLGKDEGRMVEVDFTSVNCDSLEMDLGYSVSKDYPMFFDTIPNIALPIVLDKTVHTVTYKGVENNSIGIDMFPYDGNYFWVKITYYVTCTSGTIKVRYSK